MKNSKSKNSNNKALIPLTGKLPDTITEQDLQVMLQEDMKRSSQSPRSLQPFRSLQCRHYPALCPFDAYVITVRVSPTSRSIKKVCLEIMVWIFPQNLKTD